MKFKKLHNVIASVFAATFFAAPSTNAGLWSDIKSFFGISSSGSSSTRNNTDTEENNTTDPQEHEKLNALIEQLVKQNDVPIFTTINGRRKESSKTLKRLSYNHYNSVISNKNLNSKLGIQMANESNLNHGNDIFLILSKEEDNDISNHIQDWEAKKKDYRNRHENIIRK